MPTTVAADLLIEVGGVRAHLTDRDGDLVLTADDPAAVLTPLRRLRAATSGRRGLPAAAAPPDGTRLVLAGPRGDVASVALRAGRPHLRTARLHRPRELLGPAGVRTAVAVTALATTAVAWLWRRGERRRRRR